MYIDVDLKDCEKLKVGARGRNSWFKPVRIEVQQIGHPLPDEVGIAVYSRREGQEPPIWLRLPAKKALELAKALFEMAKNPVQVTGKMDYAEALQVLEEHALDESAFLDDREPEAVIKAKQALHDCLELGLNGEGNG